MKKIISAILSLGLITALSFTLSCGKKESAAVAPDDVKAITEENASQEADKVLKEIEGI